MGGAAIFLDKRHKKIIGKDKIMEELKNNIEERAQKEIQRLNKNREEWLRKEDKALALVLTDLDKKYNYLENFGVLAYE